MILPLKPGKSSKSYASFRPIALNSCVGKAIEKLEQTHFAWYLEHCKGLPDSMTGFRRGMLTIDSIRDLVALVAQRNFENKIIVAVFLDICSVYDQFKPDPILQALLSIGISGIMLTWI